MIKDIFDYLSYKRYLLDILKHRPGGGHGFRSRIAEALNCRTAYVSQVLNKEAHFSLEQGEALNQLLGHTREESEFFLLLIQYERAGSHALRERLKLQIDLVLEKRLVLKDRVDIKKALSLIDQATYYSAWYYAAIHILITITAFQTKEALVDYLRLSTERISEVLEFLISVGLVNHEQGRYTPGVSRIFLGNDSPMIFKHHTNWRMRAIDSLDRGIKTDLHFSTVVSLAKEDVIRIKEQLVKNIEEARGIITKSVREEELHCFCVDFFKI